MSVHVVVSAGARWMTTVVMPAPVPSLAVAVNVRVPLRYAPGSASVTSGALLSTRTPATTADVAELPALSTAIARRS